MLDYLRISQCIMRYIVKTNQMECIMRYIGKTNQMEGSVGNATQFVPPPQNMSPVGRYFKMLIMRKVKLVQTSNQNRWQGNYTTLVTPLSIFLLQRNLVYRREQF